MRVASLLFAALWMASSAAAQSYLDCHFAPGWEQAGEKRQYTADNLFDYKDGGAEGYLIFGFTRMVGITCKPGSDTRDTDTLDIDVSEMSDPEAAWGLLSVNLNPDQPVEKLGAGAQIGKQSAAFAKGKYYVELVETTSNPETDQSALLRAIVKKMLPLIEGSDTQPDALAWFPTNVVSPILLVPESVLGLRQLQRGFVAKYAVGQAFIAPQASPEAAAAVLQRLREYFIGAKPAAVGNEAFQITDKYLGALCIFRKGRILAGYANLPEASDATKMAGQLADRIP